MKTQALIALLLVATMAGNLLVLQRERRLETAVAALHAPRADFPLGETMGYLQRYADKLWRASQAHNWALAGYYRDEMDETAGDIVDAKVVKNGFPVADNIQALLRPALAALAKPVAARDAAAVSTAYVKLIATCNACHQASGHPFIRIALPTPSSDRWNQDFGSP